jgi:hypothetical protein
MTTCTYFEPIEYESYPATCDNGSVDFFSYLDNTETSVIVGVDNEEIMVMYTSYMHRIALDDRREIMKGHLRYDLRDLPVMIGAGFFFSSVSGVSWMIASDSPTPNGLGLAAALVGLVVGAIVSVKARDAR